jgi:hypothetical protein
MCAEFSKKAAPERERVEFMETEQITSKLPLILTSDERVELPDKRVSPRTERLFAAVIVSARKTPIRESPCDNEAGPRLEREPSMYVSPSTVKQLPKLVAPATLNERSRHTSAFIS